MEGTESASTGPGDGRPPNEALVEFLAELLKTSGALVFLAVKEAA